MVSSSPSLLLAVIAVAFIVESYAFTPAAFVSTRSRTPQQQQKQQSYASSSSALQAVVDIDNEAAFDKTIQNAKGGLVIVDYSTTWCGPCKVIAPKFDEFSEKYPDAVFLKVIGDASPEASKLMKREGVRSVPSFHYFVDGEKVDVVNGANAEAIEAAITKHGTRASA